MVTLLASEDWTFASIEASRPNVARMSNYLLGGKDNYAIDRSAVWEAMRCAPEMNALAQANRRFMARAVRRLIEQEHIDQFIDLGSGIPIGTMVHDVAGAHLARPRVVYVDNDPVVVSHGRALLDNGDNVTVVQGDIRAPEAVIGDPRLTATIDLGRPVAVLCTGTLHYIRDSEHPGGIMSTLHDAMAPGSALVLSHLCGDDADPEAVDGLQQVYARANAPLTVRTRAEIAGFFDGFDMVDPGPVEVEPRPAAEESGPALGVLGAIARRSRA